MFINAVKKKISKFEFIVGIKSDAVNNYNGYVLSSNFELFLSRLLNP